MDYIAKQVQLTTFSAQNFSKADNVDMPSSTSLLTSPPDPYVRTTQSFHKARPSPDACRSHPPAAVQLVTSNSKLRGTYPVSNNHCLVSELEYATSCLLTGRNFVN